MRIELMTMWYNEEFLAPFFLNHYSWIDRINLIIDADTNDNTESIARQYPNVEIEYYKFPDMMDDLIKVNKFNDKYKTLTEADYVILADSDEFIFCNQIKKAVRTHLEYTSKNVYFVNLWQIYKHKDDLPLNPDIPVTSQRLHGDPNMEDPFNILYVKPMIVKGRKNLYWKPGNHELIYEGNSLEWKSRNIERMQNLDVSARRDDMLQGSHWRLVDLDETIKRRIINRKQRQSKFNLQTGLTSHYHNITKEDIVREYEFNKNRPIVISNYGFKDDSLKEKFTLNKDISQKSQTICNINNNSEEPAINNLISKQNSEDKIKRSFVIPVLDMSPASPYNIIKLLDDFAEIEGDMIIIFNSLEVAEKLKGHPRIDYYSIMNVNVGVSRAWNIGLNISKTPVTFILNSDLHINKNTIENLERYLLKLPEAAIVGPQGSFFNFYKAKDLAYFDKDSFNTPFEVDAVSGFLFAVKTDYQFTPCYFEEWDMGLQIKLAGLKSYIVPSSGYNHEWSGSIRALKSIKYLDKEETVGEILKRNRTLFLKKWNELVDNISERKNILISNWANLLLNQAKIFSQQNEKEKSLQIYKQVLEEFPEYEKVLSEFGLFLYEENKLEESLVIFNNLLKVNPDCKIPVKKNSDLINKTNEILKNKNGNGKFKMLVKQDKNYYANERDDVQKFINTNSKRILDIGCGSGGLGAALKNKLDAEVWGVEYISDIASLAMEKLDIVINDSIENAVDKLPDKYFDTVIFADVLEHLVNPYDILQNIKTKLATNGEIVASIPNVRHWSVVKKLLEGDWEYQEFGIMDNTHLRFFTRKSIYNMFEKAGYRIIGIIYVVLEMENLSPQLISAMTESNINVDTLNGESKHVQYIVKAVKK